MSLRLRLATNYKQVGTHIPTLLKAVANTTGDVCEIGSGFASTPLLHWICQGRNLVTYENDPGYLNFAKKFKTNNHRVRTLKQIEFNRHWSVVFIDHDNKETSRGDMALKFTNADLIVLHDTEPRSEANYGYPAMWSHFKYRYDWTECNPHTSVVSNTIDVTQWSSQS